MKVASLWGTSVGYTEYGDSVGIEHINGRYAVIRKETFDYLYCRLDDFNAALKEDCISYNILSFDNPSIPDSVVLMNFKGDLMCMDHDEFTKYYDILEG